MPIGTLESVTEVVEKTLDAKILRTVLVANAEDEEHWKDTRKNASDLHLAMVRVLEADNEKLQEGETERQVVSRLGPETKTKMGRSSATR